MIVMDEGRLDINACLIRLRAVEMCYVEHRPPLSNTMLSTEQTVGICCRKNELGFPKGRYRQQFCRYSFPFSHLPMLCHPNIRDFSLLFFSFYILLTYYSFSLSRSLHLRVLFLTLYSIYGSQSQASLYTKKETSETFFRNYRMRLTQTFHVEVMKEMS